MQLLEVIWVDQLRVVQCLYEIVDGKHTVNQQFEWIDVQFLIVWADLWNQQFIEFSLVFFIVGLGVVKNRILFYQIFNPDDRQQQFLLINEL